jgi:hypothetical protein
MRVGHVVVRLCIEIQVGAGGLPVHTVPQGAVWSSAYVNVHEGKVTVQLSLHGERDVGMNVVEVVNEIIQLSWSVRPVHECVIHVTVPAIWLLGCPA